MTQCQDSAHLEIQCPAIAMSRVCCYGRGEMNRCILNSQVCPSIRTLLSSSYYFLLLSSRYTSLQCSATCASTFMEDLIQSQ